jgi:hypothetical protein
MVMVDCARAAPPVDIARPSAIRRPPHLERVIASASIFSRQ